jgi:hypothetical protein
LRFLAACAQSTVLLVSPSSRVYESSFPWRNLSIVSPCLVCLSYLCRIRTSFQDDPVQCDLRNVFLPKLSRTLVLDTREYSNSSRFIRHSCQPNCIAQVMSSLSHESCMRQLYHFSIPYFCISLCYRLGLCKAGRGSEYSLLVTYIRVSL